MVLMAVVATTCRILALSTRGPRANFRISICIACFEKLFFSGSKNSFFFDKFTELTSIETPVTTAQPGPGPPYLDIVDASPARVDLAVSTLKNPPVRTRVTQVTGPLDESAVRLEHLERVCAVVSYGHVSKV
ncbi:hypothetical protein M434DRAFT_151274 [Hypoxylon sp. CO27-5]|nr:hypothetical protein M434DRAFT_151274 [Hypoxylon sp. CO27-5]